MAVYVKSHQQAARQDEIRRVRWKLNAISIQKNSRNQINTPSSSVDFHSIIIFVYWNLQIFANKTLKCRLISNLKDSCGKTNTNEREVAERKFNCCRSDFKFFLNIKKLCDMISDGSRISDK